MATNRKRELEKRAAYRNYRFELTGTFFKQSELDKFLAETEELNKIGVAEPGQKKPLFKATITNDLNPVRALGVLKTYPIHMFVEFSTPNTEVIDRYLEDLNDTRSRTFFGGFSVIDLNTPKYLDRD